MQTRPKICLAQLEPSHSSNQWKTGFRYIGRKSGEPLEGIFTRFLQISERESISLSPVSSRLSGTGISTAASFNSWWFTQRLLLHGTSHTQGSLSFDNH